MDETYVIDSDTAVLDLPSDVPSDSPVYLLSILPVDQLGDGQEPKAVDEADGDSEILPGELPGDGWELAGIETYGLSPINPSDTSGLKKILLEILGPYDNIVTQYRYTQQNNSYYTYVNDITPDYPWIFSAVLFIVLVVSVFRMFRSVLWKQ